MKTCTYRFYILALLVSLSSAMYAHVNVVYPVGGETFLTGLPIEIEWEILQNHELLDWDVYYSLDSGENWIPLAINLPPSQLTYDWVIPDGLETTLGRVKVYMNNVGDDYIDYSGIFSIELNTSPPIIDFEAQDITIPCDVANQQAEIQVWLNNNGYASATSYCGTLTWTHDFSFLSEDCGATGDASVIFTATNDCGSVETEAVLIVQDVTAPTLTSPAANMAVATDGQGNITQLNAWLNSKGGATATDACSSITWTNNFTSVEPACGNTGSATVTFTAHDACGNATITEATFTISDQLHPTLLQPAYDLSIPVGPAIDSLLQNWLANHGGANASDLGGDVTWQHNFTNLTDGCGATGNATVTFTATDPCGNSVGTVATVQVTDQTPPVFETGATDNVVYCGDNNSQVLLQQWLNSHGGASAADNGGGFTWQHNFNGLSDGCGTTGSAIVTFTATDECGNSAFTTGTFQLTDPTPPVIETVAHDTTVYCPQNDISTVTQQWLSRHGGANATDQCGNVSWTHNFTELIDACELQPSYPVTFTVWDECLNSQLTSATFTMIDTTVTSVLNLLDMEFRLFPNPVDDAITVEWEYNESIPVQLTLLDAFGRNVWSAQSTSDRIVIPVDSYASGVYFLSCKRKMSVGMRMVIIE